MATSERGGDGVIWKGVKTESKGAEMMVQVLNGRFVRQAGLAFLFVATIGLRIVAGGAPEETSAKEPPYGLSARIPWTTSRVIGSPEPPLPYTLGRAMPSLKFNVAITVVPEPGGKRLILLQYDGQLHSITGSGDDRTSRLWFDLEPDEPAVEKKEDGDGKGESKPTVERRNWSGIAFHPNYESNGYLYIFSNGPQSGPRRNRISRFTAELVDGERVPKRESELVILEWVSEGHDGGDLVFGPEGMLYISAGDGTSSSDVLVTGQDLSDLRSGILRIDVDHPDNGKPYGIPRDNPFLNTIGARGEIWAFGSRNPWRLSFDPPTGRIFVGDVGQDQWEMIFLVTKGANFGWSVREGSHPFMPERQQGPAPFVNPVAEHPHSESRCITGGHVYRGKRYPGLEGKYIYCDYDTGKVWGLAFQGDQPLPPQDLADTTYKIAGVGRDLDDELLFIVHTGEILRLEQTPPAVTAMGDFPRKLSETGLFEDVISLKPAPGVIPYSVNSPLWSDGAIKERWLSVPGDAKIDLTEDQRGWGFPDGSVIVKSFAREVVPENPESRKRVETRLLVKQNNEWEGFSYAWNDEQTDALLVEKEGRNVNFNLPEESSDSEEILKQWRFPSRTECMMCHSRAARYVLGISTPQMNGNHDYGGVIDNQMR
ncbi:MAG: PQQ-dependent sugar dehydrogenase, partial [Planctomycetaceae bacterium]|nr:PQQ-dependent sugar dehydrogenase [Planctomycetaceae bacterium]